MGNSQKKVSVLMSTYNSESCVSHSIESILKQSYKNIEFLIVDDCSTDNTFGILQEYSKKYERIKVFKNVNNFQMSSTESSTESSTDTYAFQAEIAQLMSLIINLLI